MPIQVRGVLVHAMSGTELSRVRTELQLRLPEPINKSPLESRGAEIVMQSCEVLVRQISSNATIRPSGIELVDTSAFVGTNSTGELTTSGLPGTQESHSRMPSMPAYTPRRAEERRRLILLP
jgi:hypothetical protein